MAAAAALVQGAAIAAQPAPDAAASCCTIAADTPVMIEIVAALGSRRSRTGERFAIRLAQPILAGERVLVPAGTPGVGEVVHAARATGGIMPGELILAARYLQHGATRIPLHRMRFFESGADGTMRFFAGYPASYFAVSGGRNVEVPAGAVLAAQVAGTVSVPAD